MSGGFPPGIELCNGQAAGAAATSSTAYGTAVASSATANALGSWTQLTAATAADTCWMVVNIWNTGSYNNIALDIGVGPAGSEVVVAHQICVGVGYDYVINFPIPCSIPAGTRIAARAQATAASITSYVTLQLFDGAFADTEGMAGVEGVGFTASSTTSTAVAAGSTANTPGAYTQLIASSGRDYAGFFLSFRAAFPTNDYPGYADIAIGASGSEQVIVPSCLFYNNSFQATMPVTTIYWVPIPSGTRIATRITSAATGWSLNVGFNGIYK
jgi:hypothetical protein